ALTRQSAPVVALSLGLAVALIARGRAVRFLTAATGALLVTAGPWWVIQTVRFGNPLESNLSLLRVAKRRSSDRSDAALATLATVFVSSWVAFVAELVRFPQRGGDPIKGHYLLFLAPVSAAFAIAAGYALARRGGWPRAILVAWAGVYAVSWALTVA